MQTNSEECMLSSLTRREVRAIQKFYEQVFCDETRPDTFEEMAQHWQRHYAAKWRVFDHVQAMAMQRDEIARHKWILSEKAGHDLGSWATNNWIFLYAALWREWYETACDIYGLDALE